MTQQQSEGVGYSRHGDARTFRGRIAPGPGKVVIKILPESEDYTVPGSGHKLWLPRPATHTGFTGVLDVECAPYFDVNSGETYQPIFKKGAVVVVGKFTGTKVTLNRDEYIVCREQDIVCEIIPDDANSELRAESSSQSPTT